MEVDADQTDESVEGVDAGDRERPAGDVLERATPMPNRAPPWGADVDAAGTIPVAQRGSSRVVAAHLEGGMHDGQCLGGGDQPDPGVSAVLPERDVVTVPDRLHAGRPPVYGLCRRHRANTRCVGRPGWDGAVIAGASRSIRKRNGF